jgi:hypothetical protein
MTDETIASAEALTMMNDTPPQRGALGAWWREGLRAALLMRPSWSGLWVSPAIVASLVLVLEVVGVLLERLFIAGPANFYWRALFTGWLQLVVTLFAAWIVLSDVPAEDDRKAPGPLALFAMLTAQSLFLTMASTIIFLPMVRGGTAPAFMQPMFYGILAWQVVAVSLLMWRGATAGWRRRIAAIGLVLVSTALHIYFQPLRHWYAANPAPVASAAAAKGTGTTRTATDTDTDEDTSEPLRLSQQVLEGQPRLLQSKLAALQPGRPGVVDVYAITFAPHAGEDVFKREGAMVASVMQERFGAAGKTLQLLNHASTATEHPWATPLNLQRAIQRVAQVMNRDEDVLFIHLTSHGGRDGVLATEFYPLDIESVTPRMLRGWLDEADIKHRVISISACYSGSWIPPLAEPDTLVMTAADADHTSYGCGHRSPLTFFGRAMYDEALRHTWSFEQAHAAARLVIDKREREGGKTDGYSNPQIRVGDAIRPTLARLEAERAKAMR